MDALPKPPSSPPITNLLLVLALFTCLAAGVVWAWHTLHLAQIQQSTALQEKETLTLARQIETLFTYQTKALDRLAQRWPHQRSRKTLWQRDAHQLITDFNNIKAIQWMDNDYRMQWRAATDTLPATIFEYPATHPNMPYLREVRETHQPVLSSHFELRQGGTGVAYSAPLYRDAQQQQLDGYLIGVFQIEPLLNNLLYRLPTEHMSVVITDGKQSIFERTQTDILDANRHLHTELKLGNNPNFTLHTYPNTTMDKRYQTAVPTITLITGLLACLLLCYALWLGLLNAQRLADLKLSNRTLKAEVRKRVETEDHLQKSQSRLQLILQMTDHSSDALFILSIEPLAIVYMNRPCWTSLGYTEEQLRNVVAINASDVMLGADGWINTLREQINHRRSATYQRHVRTRSGKTIPLEVNVRHLHRFGKSYLVCVARNNRNQLEVTAHLEKLSQLDGLTGLFNRRYFDAALSGEWRRLQRQQLPLGLLMIDVDFFKPYNDHLGHQAGDNALRQLANILQLHVGREGEQVCRYGGEEFSVLLPGADINQCHKVANLLHQAMRKLQLTHSASPFKYVTISIGIASMVPTAEDQPDMLLRAADRALYKAKAQGRNRSADDEDGAAG